MRKLVILSLTLSLFLILLLAGCEEIEVPADNSDVVGDNNGDSASDGVNQPDTDQQNEVTNFEECVEKTGIVMESYPRQCRYNDQTFVEEIDEPIAPPEDFACEDMCGDGECQEMVCQADGCPCAEDELICEEDCGEQGPRCGDGTCDPNEDCGICFQDCKCESPAECHNRECVVPECGSAGDCNDENACTKDECFFAGHPNAYCGYEDIKKCRDNDGCCPGGCTSVDDDDCKVECGNDVCEEGEDEENCEEDCVSEPECGDQVCDEYEEETCPQDCYDYECGNYECEPGEDYETCPEDCV